MKRIFNKTQKVVRGMPTAVVVSILIHAGLFFGATVLVIFKFRPPPPVKFEPPPPVKVPKMPLKKLQVKMRKPTKPKSSAKITAVVPKLDLHEIAFPDLASSGMGAGLGSGGEIVSFGDMPDFEDVSVFGGEQSTGNDFEGTMYSLNHSRSGGISSMGQDEFRLVLRKFVRSGWNNQVLGKYYRAEKKLYTPHFMVPPIPSVMAPEVFGAPDLESYYFFIKYKGQLVYPEDITFRFWGIGDAYMFVRVGGKEVFIAAWPFHEEVAFNWWRGNDAKHRRYYLGNQLMTVGDWITLKAGEPVDMEVLFGEWKGGIMSAMLLVEVEGVEYPKNRQNGPILPAFRTSKLSRDMREEIERYLPVEEACLTNGPVFSDF